MATKRQNKKQEAPAVETMEVETTGTSLMEGLEEVGIPVTDISGENSTNSVETCQLSDGTVVLFINTIDGASLKTKDGVPNKEANIADIGGKYVGKRLVDGVLMDVTLRASLSASAHRASNWDAEQDAWNEAEVERAKKRKRTSEIGSAGASRTKRQRG